MKSFCLCLLVLLGGCVAHSQEVRPEKILKHITALADDDMGGRGTGTADEEAAAAYIGGEFKKIGLSPLGENNSWFQKFTFTKGVHGQGAIDTAQNVIGYLDNGGATTIIIGAHYDHLGTDGQGTSLDANPAAKIHNGADDNASGVAGMLALASYFANNKATEKNNFVFIGFSGEELGLLGSKYFTEHPTTDLAKANFMINLDMIGRLDTSSMKLIVNGTGTSPVWEPLLKKIDAKGLSIVTDSSGTGPSDHTSFYLKDIPVLHFFTGAHPDYHKPSDDVEKINAPGTVKVVELIIDLIGSLDRQPKLQFLKTRTTSQNRPAAFKVTMGIMPSYTSDVTGLKVDGVMDDKPAAKAGILTGDIIIKMGEMEIKDIYGYMEALGKFSKGQTVPVTVRRGDKTVELSVTF